MLLIESGVPRTPGIYIVYTDGFRATSGRRLMEWRLGRGWVYPTNARAMVEKVHGWIGPLPYHHSSGSGGSVGRAGRDRPLDGGSLP